MTLLFHNSQCRLQLNQHSFFHQIYCMLEPCLTQQFRRGSKHESGALRCLCIFAGPWAFQWQTTPMRTVGLWSLLESSLCPWRPAWWSSPRLAGSWSKTESICGSHIHAHSTLGHERVCIFGPIKQVMQWACEHFKVLILPSCLGCLFSQAGTQDIPTIWKNMNMAVFLNKHSYTPLFLVN